MNQPIRRLVTLVCFMFIALMLAATNVQFIQAPDLNADSRNVRTMYREYEQDRGPIVVAGEPVVTSVPVDDRFSYLRTYHSGTLYGHVSGYFSVAFNSMTGIERAENSVLGGTDSSFALRRLQDLVTGEQPQGGGVELTLDPAMQQAAATALGDQRGAIVAIEPETGRILALYSSPSFDPNLMAVHDRATAQANYDQLLADANKPLMNRAIAGDLYAPGSVFKVITATAMLENGAEPDTMVEAPTEYRAPGTSHLIQNPGEAACGDGSGEVTLSTALRLSCNTPFAIAAVEMGAEELESTAEAFGFGQDLSVPLRVTPSQFPVEPTQAELALTGFGQFSLKVTPMQMAMVASAIANNGTLMTPYLVDRTLTADLAVIETNSPKVFSTPMSESTARELNEMMIGVVENGTGTRAAIPGIQVAGKTGTAEISAEVPAHAWFIGYAPADNPQIAIAVLVENGGNVGFGGDGGRLAAPIAQQVLVAGLQ